MNLTEINQSLEYITYGLYLVTSSLDGKPNGMIVNTVFQVTAEPARVAISVNKKSLTHEYIMQTKAFVAQPLTEQAPFTFIGNFGFRTGRNFNKFEKVVYENSPLNLPIVKEHTLSGMEVVVDKIVDVDTHTLFIGTVHSAQIFTTDEAPMTYHYYHTVLRGKTPEGATHR